MKNKNILIIGGEGFVGENLINRLYSNNRVYSLDNKINSRKVGRKKGVTYVHDDAEKVFSHFNDKNIEVIFHLGEYSRVEKSFDKFDFILENNHRQFYNVCKFASVKNAKLIYSASSTVFTRENADFEPSPYQIFKKFNIEFLKTYSRFKNIDYAITYFYNVYGNGEVEDGEFATVVAKFLARAKKGLPLEVTLPGEQKRNFTHVADIVAALELIGDVGQGDELGIGADESYSVIELAQMLSSNIVLTPEKKGNRLEATLNTDKTKALGWRPKIMLKQYIDSEKSKWSL